MCSHVLKVVINNNWLIARLIIILILKNIIKFKTLIESKLHAAKIQIKKIKQITKIFHYFLPKPRPKPYPVACPFPDENTLAPPPPPPPFPVKDCKNNQN